MLDASQLVGRAPFRHPQRRERALLDRPAEQGVINTEFFEAA
jgi:hypothetical protein